MKKEKLLTSCLIYFIGLFGIVLSPLPSYAPNNGLTLEEVVEAVNFSRRLIEGGELSFFFYLSPKTKNSRAEAERKLQKDREYWHAQLLKANSKRQRERAEVMIQFYEEYLEHLITGNAIYKERNVVFKVHDNANNQDLRNAYFARINSIDRSILREASYQDAAPKLSLFNRDFRHINSYSTVIVNGEYTAQLKVRSGANYVLFLQPVPMGTLIPFHLMGRTIYHIDPKTVKSFGQEYDGENLYYVIEFVPHEVDLSTFALEVELVTKKIWVDPRLDFSAVKSEFAFYIKAKRILKERTEFKAYRRFPSDIWYPTSVHCDTYHPITRKILTQFSYHLLEADFTNDIPDDFFDVSRDDIGILVSDIW